MTDQMIRGLTIAASVFFAVATISAGILYYTTVVGVTDQFNNRTDISKDYEYAIVRNIEDKFNSKDNITGIDARNLVYTLQGMGGFSVNLVNVANQIIEANLNNRFLDSNGSIKMLEIQKLIHPNATVSIRKFESIENILNISLYVEN